MPKKFECGCGCGQTVQTAKWHCDDEGPFYVNAAHKQKAYRDRKRAARHRLFLERRAAAGTSVTRF